MYPCLDFGCKSPGGLLTSVLPSLYILYLLVLTRRMSLLVILWFDVPFYSHFFSSDMLIPVQIDGP